MTRLIVLGGFLGAGKTTTLLRLAADLVDIGKTVGILTNDQGQELVDTELFRASGLQTRGVRGGCFCCRLGDFLDRADGLVSAMNPDILLAEPVGGCTDPVATVLRPLRQLRPGDFAIGPYTVVVDPIRARDALSRDGKATLSQKVTYIYGLQQQGADAIAINKSDVLSAAALGEVRRLLRDRFPDGKILTYYARTGTGFDELTQWLLGPDTGSISRSPDIDYDVYAEREAELA
jgi:G3E family GTPase